MTKVKSEKIENKKDNLPNARDFKLPKKLSKEDKELIKATREAMEALAKEQEKYGDRLSNL